MAEVFYYGLYMDPQVRARAGAGGGVGEIARLDGWAMRLGQRSTLELQDGAVTWGTVVDQSQADLAALYPATTHAAYRPVTLTLAVGETPREATAFVAPLEAIGPHDPAYAEALAALCRRLGLPQAYAEAIR